jgi:hypothetical protein
VGKIKNAGSGERVGLEQDSTQGRCNFIHSIIKKLIRPDIFATKKQRF